MRGTQQSRHPPAEHHDPAVMDAQILIEEQQLLPVVDRHSVIPLPWIGPISPLVQNCPLGLVNLLGLNAITMRKHGCNKYTVESSAGHAILHSVQENSCCCICFCGINRNYAMSFKEVSGIERIHMEKKTACKQELQIHSPDGTLIGTVTQDCTLIRPKFSIKNNIDDTVLRIEGPIITTTCCGNKDFRVMANKEVIGKITKKPELTSDELIATFPVDLDVRMKALLLGACVLIDTAFYDNRGILGCRLNCHRLLVVIFFLFCTLAYIAGKGSVGMKREFEGSTLKIKIPPEYANIMGEGNRWSDNVRSHWKTF